MPGEEIKPFRSLVGCRIWNIWSPFQRMKEGDSEASPVTRRGVRSPSKRRAGRWQCIRSRPLREWNIAPTHRDER